MAASHGTQQSLIHHSHRMPGYHGPGNGDPPYRASIRLLFVPPTVRERYRRAANKGQYPMGQRAIIQLWFKWASDYETTRLFILMLNSDPLAQPSPRTLDV